MSAIPALVQGGLGEGTDISDLILFGLDLSGSAYTPSPNPSPSSKRNHVLVRTDNRTDVRSLVRTLS